MRPQYYADEYRRYQTYVRNYDPQKPIQKICGGANVDDYDWTRKVLETTHDHTVPEFHGFMDGLSCIIMCIRKAGKSREVQRILMKKCGIRH